MGDVLCNNKSQALAPAALPGISRQHPLHRLNQMIAKRPIVKKFTAWGPLSPLVLAFAALVFGIDQTHKWWMLGSEDIANRQPIELTSFLELVLVWNPGISYGLLRSHQQLWLVQYSGDKLNFLRHAFRKVFHFFVPPSVYVKTFEPIHQT